MRVGVFWSAVLLGVSTLGLDCLPASHPVTQPPASATTSIQSYPFTNETCNSVDTCRALLEAIVAWRRECVRAHDLKDCSIHDAEISRFSKLYEKLDHDVYVQEHALVKFDLSDAENRALAPCDAAVWRSRLNEDVACWSILLSAEFAAFVRAHRACSQSQECGLVRGPICPSEIGVNRRYEKEIGEKSSELWDRLHSKRFVSGSCRIAGPLGAACIANECIGI